MQTHEIRLECLKLAHRHDRTADEVLAQARTYAAWVGGVPDLSTTPRGPNDIPKEETLAPLSNPRTSPSKGAKA